MEQTRKIFSRSCQNKNSGKFDIRKDIKYFQQTILTKMIDTPDLRNENNSKSHSLVLFKRGSERSYPKLF